MDEDAFEGELKTLKTEAEKSFDEKCKSPYRVDGSKRTTIKDDFAKKLDGHMKDRLKRHKDFIDKNGVRVVYNGKNQVNTKADTLTVNNGTCNEVTEFKWMETYRVLKTIVVGDGCCTAVTSFVLRGLPCLESVTIGENSFTSSYGRLFSITNCYALDTITIKRNSFEYFTEFILEELSKLTNLRIGDRHQESCNFKEASFVVRSVYGR